MSAHVLILDTSKMHQQQAWRKHVAVRGIKQYIYARTFCVMFYGKRAAAIVLDKEADP